MRVRLLQCLKLVLTLPLIVSTQDENEKSFAISLYQRLARTNAGQSLIVSPLSIQTALTVAFTAAGGKTADELQNGLVLGTNDRHLIGEEAHKIVSSLNSSKVITMVNKIYVKNDYPVRKEFNHDAKYYFNSEVTNIDFGNKGKAAREINDYVAEKTNHRFLDFIDPDMLTSDTRMLLINTIYMKAVWKVPFDNKSIKKREFHLNQRDTVEVESMKVKGYFKYNEISSLQAKVIELPFKNGDSSVFVILPNKLEGLWELESQLEDFNIDGMRKLLKPAQVSLQMPKFKFDSGFSLKRTLTEMGMPTMFSNSANFHDLTTSREYLKVADVLHKAMIDFNEDGVEVAAGTAVRLTLLTGGMFQEHMVVDHPFMFVIAKGNTVVFAGRFIGPRDSLPSPRGAPQQPEQGNTNQEIPQWGSENGQVPPNYPADGQVPPNYPQNYPVDGQAPPNYPQNYPVDGQAPPNYPTDGQQPPNYPQNYPENGQVPPNYPQEYPGNGEVPPNYPANGQYPPYNPQDGQPPQQEPPRATLHKKKSRSGACGCVVSDMANALIFVLFSLNILSHYYY